MTFPRINPSGYSVGAKVTSGQFNALDVDHAAALNGSTAGDELLGVITMGSGAQIQASVAAGFQTTTPGGLQLAGGSTDWPTFSAPRTISRYATMGPLVLTVGWSLLGSQIWSDFVVGPANTTFQATHLDVRHGWTLTSVNLQMAVANAHSNVPAVLPSFDVKRTTLPSAGGSASPTVVSLSTGGAVSFTASTGAGWYDSGVVQQLAFTPNQFNVIDGSAFSYSLVLQDENGSNSIAGNIYFGAEMVFTATNLAPT